MPRTKATTAPESSPSFDFNRPFQKLRWETFQKFQHEYPNQEAVSLYLYRLWPVIDRKLAGVNVKNIDVFKGPVSEEDLLRTHGSGKYLLTFNDTNRPKNQCKVAETKIDLNDNDFPPVLDQRELVVGIRENESYIAGLRARGLWEREKEAPVQHSDNPATAELARLVSNMTGKLLDKEQAAAAPADPFDQALRMLTIMKEFSPKPTPIQQVDPYDVALKLVALVQPKAAEAKEDPLEMYARVSETVERIATRFDRGSGGSGWSQVLLKLLDTLPAVVQGVLAVKGAPGPMMPTSPLPVPVSVQPMETPMPQSEPIDMPALFQAIRPYLFRAMTTGQSGDEFASGLVTFVGQDKYEVLAAQGEEGLLGFLRQQQDIWPMLQPFEERVREFIGEFLSYGQAPPDDGGAPAADGTVIS